MTSVFATVLSLTIIVILQNTVHCSEPMCSKYHFEEQLLEKSIRTEIFVETMSKEMKTVQEEVQNALQQFDKDFKDEMKKLIEEKALLKNEIETLKSESVQEILVSTTKMETTFKHQEAQITRLSEDFREMENNTIKRLISTVVTPTVAFKARSVADTSPATDQVLLFTTNIVSEGGGYDANTGIFTSPVDGVYLFTVQFCVKAGNYFYFAIVSDDKILANAQVGDPSWNICHSSDAIAVMKKGMHTVVKCTSSTGNVLHSSTLHWNTFSGVILHN